MSSYGRLWSQAKRHGYQIGIGATTGRTKHCLTDLRLTRGNDMMAFLIDDINQLEFAAEQALNWLNGLQEAGVK